MENDDSIFSGLTKRRKEESNKRALIAGATPLLIGLLAGNTGDAAEIASKGLLQEDERVRKDDDSLLSYLRKKQISESKSGGTKKYSFPTGRDEKGNPILLRGNAITGELEPTDYAKGYSTKFRKNAEGQTVEMPYKRGDKMTTVSTKGEETGLDSSITPKFKERADKITSSLISDTKGWRDAHQEMTEAKRLLSDPKSGIFGTKVAVANLIKKVEKGRMSDEDRRYYISHLSTLRGLLEGISKEMSGKEKKRLLDEVNSSLDTLIDTTSQKISLESEARAEGFSDTPQQKELLLKRFGAAKGLSPRVMKKTKTQSLDPFTMPIEDVRRMTKELSGE